MSSGSYSGLQHRIDDGISKGCGKTGHVALLLSLWGHGAGGFQLNARGVVEQGEMAGSKLRIARDFRVL